MTKEKTPPKIFLLIGITKEGSHWDDVFIQNIKLYFKTDDVITMDIPGNGRRLHEKTPFSIGGIVKEMRKSHLQDISSDSEKTEEKSREKILIAASLGGMIGATWLSLFPKDFDSFVMINSSLRNFSPLTSRVQPTAMIELIKIFLARSVEEKESMIVGLTSNNLQKHPELKKKWIRISQERPLSRMNIVRQAIAGATCRVERAPTVPTLLIASKHDRLAHPSCSEKIHQNWGGKLHFFDDEKCGHGLHLDAPEELAKVIYDWTVTQRSLKTESVEF